MAVLLVEPFPGIREDRAGSCVLSGSSLHSRSKYLAFFLLVNDAPDVWGEQLAAAATWRDISHQSSGEDCYSKI